MSEGVRMTEFCIGTRRIALDTLPYLIAEIGLNHDGALERAKDLIWQAKRGGADAVKFQSLKAAAQAHPNSPTYFQQNGHPAETQHAFFARSDGFARSDYEALAATAQEAGIDFLCTPFYLACVEWLTPLVPAWKIASADITNLPLLKAVALTGKPVLLSTGAATRREIEEAHDWLRGGGCPVALLHCVLAYPTPTESANLLVIPWIAQTLHAPVGYSDHTLATPEMETCFLAYCVGARIIEKHFTGVGEQSRPGNDHYHSMDACQLAYLKAAIQDAHRYFGQPEKQVLAIEEPARQHARRGLYAARAVAKGHPWEPEDIAILRPSARVGPECYEEFLGKPAVQDYVTGEPL